MTQDHNIPPSHPTYYISEPIMVNWNLSRLAGT
jgi:hypothetical protein